MTLLTGRQELASVGVKSNIAHAVLMRPAVTRSSLNRPGDPEGVLETTSLPGDHVRRAFTRVQ